MLKIGRQVMYISGLIYLHHHRPEHVFRQLNREIYLNHYHYHHSIWMMFSMLNKPHNDNDNDDDEKLLLLSFDEREKRKEKKEKKEDLISKILQEKNSSYDVQSSDGKSEIRKIRKGSQRKFSGIVAGI